MKRLYPIRILRVFRPAPYLCALQWNGSPFPASSTSLFTILFRNSLLPTATVRCRALLHSLGTTPRRSYSPLNLHNDPASAAITAGSLQVVVSKARENTTLRHAPCPFALPIQH